MAERITNFTKGLLETKQKELQNAAAQLGLNYGEITGSGGGDAEHDETAIQILDQWDQAKRQSMEFNALLASAGVLEPPTQNETIEVGHRVQIMFGGEPSDSAFATLVTPINIGVLSTLTADGKKVFDNDTEMVVSDESPLGNAIVGHKKGERVKVDVREKGKSIRNFEVTIGTIEAAKIF